GTNAHVASGCTQRSAGADQRVDVRRSVECRLIRANALQGRHGHYGGSGILIELADAFWAAVAWTPSRIPFFATLLQKHAGLFECRAQREHSAWIRIRGALVYG